MKTTRADRRQSINNYGHWVYGLYLKGVLVYVGVTADPAGRLASHQKSKKFDEMRLIKGFSNREKADEYEKFAILDLNPNLNIAKYKTEYNPTRIALQDFEHFLNLKRVREADFSRLDNPHIQKRMRWEQGLTDD